MAHTLNSPLRGQQQDGSGGRRFRRSSPPAGVRQFLQGASLAWHGRQVPPPRIRSLVGSRVQNLIDLCSAKAGQVDFQIELIYPRVFSDVSLGWRDHASFSEDSSLLVD